MAPEATILHADLDAFYASVEQRDDSGLRGRPIAVGTGVVLAASYEARSRGVYTTMNSARARSVCPELVMVPPRMEAYSQASREVYSIFHDTSPVVEALSIDEAFIETRGLERISGRPEEIAAGLRRRVRRQLGLAISIGVARTKFLAKLASGEAKPDGLLVVEPDREDDFLLPLPVNRLWGVGRVTADRLEQAGIRRVRDLLEARETALTELLGENRARHLLELARNRDPRRVEPRRRRKSIGAQSAFPAGSHDLPAVGSLLDSLADRVCGRLRAGSLSCRTVNLGLRFADFSRASRSHTFAYPTDGTGAVVRALRDLLSGAAEEIETGGLTLVGVSLGNLEPAGAVQTSLPLDDPPGTTASGTAAARTPGRNPAALDDALDQLRDRFGEGAVRRAAGIDRAAPAAPTLPD